MCMKEEWKTKICELFSEVYKSKAKVVDVKRN